jgi:hypothetical protein
MCDGKIEQAFESEKPAACFLIVTAVANEIGHCFI